MKKILKMVLVGALLITSVCSLTACKKGGDDMTTADINSKKIGTHYMVNDGLTDMAANGVVQVVDDKTAICYAIYLASDQKLGESDQLVKLAKFSVMQPTNVHWVTVFDRDIDFGGDNLSEGSIIDLNNDYVRVYAINMVNYVYYYKDVNKKTLEVGELKELKFRTPDSSEKTTFTKDNINAYLRSINCQEFGHLMFASNIISVNGFYYANFGGGVNMTNYIFARSADGETWNFISIVKHDYSYEVMLAYHDNKFWAFCRNGFVNPSTETRENLLYSADNGKTWTQSNLALTASDTRPFLFNYQGDLYLAYSSPLDPEYSTVRTHRCNIHIGKITSNGGKETFDEIIYKESKFGIVYYSVIDWYGKMIMLYSSGELNPERGAMNWKTQGKDCINYTILQEVDPILSLSSN